MALANMQVYDEQIRLRTIELLGQNLQAFNQSQGAITLDMSTWTGNYTRASFYASLAGAQRRVDRYNAQVTQAQTALSESEMVGVKVAGGFGPVVFEPSQLTWLASQPQEAINVIAEGFADALLADQLNTSVMSAVAAVENQAALVNDVSALTAGAGALTQTVLNGSHAKFGDMSGMLTVDVMTGAAYHKLIEKGLENGERLFMSSNVTVQSILGKTFVVSDIPALYEAGTPNKTKVLSLVSGAIIVDNASDILTNLDTSNGQTRIETTWQADYSFGVKIKGYAYDIASGGPSPNDAVLGTGSSWSLVMSDVKHTAGTLAIADLDQ
ncbi:putative major capsid protein [Vibrio phage 1.242.O._10N.261.54.B2]|nr:putative major capsid protein [Vibrio phage 1.242.O._10N.261.54.B2]